MSTDQHRTTPHDASETTATGATRHYSAFEEFRRDERHPAVLLLVALVIAAAFFALGIMLGRWMADDDNNASRPERPANTVNQSPALPVLPRPTP